MRLACVLIPRFAVAVEHRARPETEGAPLIVYDRNRVLEASEALPGLYAGQSLRQARASYPHAEFLPADLHLYRDVDEAMLRVLQQVSPLIEPAAPGCAYASLSGLGRLYADEFALAARLTECVRAATGLLPAVGIAEGKFVARVAASLCPPGDAGVVPAGREREFLRGQSVALLPVAPEIIERLEVLALRTLGDVAALPRPAAEAQFGRAGALIWDLASGIDREPLRPRAPAERLVERLSFDAPVVATETLVIAGQQLVRRLLQRLERRTARRMHLQLFAEGRIVWERLDTFREPTGDERRVVLLLKTRLAALSLTSSADTMAITLDGIGREAAQQKRLFAESSPRLDQVAEAVRQLRARYGRPVVWRAVEVDPCSRHPEERNALIPFDA